MHLRHRALFIAYAPAEQPTIAIAVAVEGGGYGGSTAAPIGRKVLDAWIVGESTIPRDSLLPERGVDAPVREGVQVPAAPTAALP